MKNLTIKELVKKNIEETNRDKDKRWGRSRRWGTSNNQSTKRIEICLQSLERINHKDLAHEIITRSSLKNIYSHLAFVSQMEPKSKEKIEQMKAGF